MIKNNTITKRNQYETQNGIFTVLFSALISCGLFAIIYFTKIIYEELHTFNNKDYLDNGN
jgi:hypothetical protein